MNDEDYRAIADSIKDEYKAVSYMVNVENWQNTADFQNNILQAVISDNGGVMFTNWHNSATFAKTGSHAEYLPFEGNETKIVRLSYVPGRTLSGRRLRAGNYFAF